VSVLKQYSLKECSFNKEESGIYKEKEDVEKCENGLKPHVIPDRLVFCTGLGAARRECIVLLFSTSRSKEKFMDLVSKISCCMLPLSR